MVWYYVIRLIERLPVGTLCMYAYSIVPFCVADLALCRCDSRPGRNSSVTGETCDSCVYVGMCVEFVCVKAYYLVSFPEGSKLKPGLSQDLSVEFRVPGWAHSMRSTHRMCLSVSIDTTSLPSFSRFVFVLCTSLFVVYRAILYVRADSDRCNDCAVTNWFRLESAVVYCNSAIVARRQVRSVLIQRC